MYREIRKGIFYVVRKVGVTILFSGCIFTAVTIEALDSEASQVINGSKSSGSPDKNIDKVVGIPVRRNIDELSDREMAAYLHALRLIMSKSEKNIYDENGFLWQAWVHN